MSASYTTPKDVSSDASAAAVIKNLAKQHSLDIGGGTVRRSSSRFCLGVEHGDYNGCPLFGVGTDRYIWLGYKANGSGKIRVASANVPFEESLCEFTSGTTPPALDPAICDSWHRFPYGVDAVLRDAGLIKGTGKGFDAVVVGNIPGGGMSRSASLCLNLVLTQLECFGVPAPEDGFDIVRLAKRVENDYMGSPCGDLDQIMIYFAKAGFGTFYEPKTQTIRHVPLGAAAPDFALVALDTGTDRPGLEKSTYKVRREECEVLQAELQRAGFLEQGEQLCAVDTKYDDIVSRYKGSKFEKCIPRLTYLRNAQRRFQQMLDAWEVGDVKLVGALFREDGLGLRDQYSISGPELETMCDIARAVPGVYGERMLGGGDKGAVGAIVAANAVQPLKDAVTLAYPLSRPDFKDSFAVHVVKPCDGLKVLDGLI